MLPIIPVLIVGASYSISRILSNVVEEKIDEQILNASRTGQEIVTDIISYYSKKFINRCIGILGTLFIAYIIGKIFNQVNLCISLCVILITLSMAYNSIKTFNIYIDLAGKFDTLDPVQIFYRYINASVYENVEKTAGEISLVKRILTYAFSKKDTIKISKEISNNIIKNCRIILIVRAIAVFLGFLIYLLVYKELFTLATGITFNAFYKPIIWSYEVIFNIHHLSPAILTTLFIISMFILFVIEFRRIAVFFKLWIKDRRPIEISKSVQKGALTASQDATAEPRSTERQGAPLGGQLTWLKDKLNFDALADMLKAAREQFPDTDIVPTLLMAGRTGAGKSSLINALAGRHISPVGVIPTTQQLTPQELEGGGVPLRVLDMPGVGEAGRHGERMDAMLAQADAAHLLLLAVPCPERSLDYETKLLSEVNRHFAGRMPLPVLAVGTRVDCAAPARDWQPATLDLAAPSTEKERNIADWLAYAASMLPGVDVLLPCSCGERFDDAAGQYGIPALRRRIFELLPDAARTYFARVTQERELLDNRAESIVRVFSGMAAAAATQPLPALPDAAVIMPVQTAMLVRLTALHGRELTADLAAKLLGPLAAREAGRFTFEQVTKLLPGIGSLVGAAVAGGMTYALGMGYHTLLCGGHWNFDADALQEEILRWWTSIVNKLQTIGPAMFKA